MFKYIRMKIVVLCPVCHDGNTPHYRLVEGGAYLCRSHILALEKEQREEENHLHLVERREAAA
jgi:hypothetical protein